MLKNGKGSIINISSASAGPPIKAFTYSVAKAGIKSNTKFSKGMGTKGVRVMYSTRVFLRIGI